MNFTRKAIPFRSKTKMADIQDYPNTEGKVRSLYNYSYTRNSYMILGTRGKSLEKISYA